jgi:uncharacterized membrane protein YfcA
MDAFVGSLPLDLFALALTAAFVAGMVKGLVGFAMPMVLISSLGSFLPPELALGALILPTLVTNGMQALREGTLAALGSLKLHWRFLLTGLVFLVGSAQLVRVLPSSALLTTIGFVVVFFSALNLLGWRLVIESAAARRRAEVSIGGFAGFIGGLSGIWGPPTVMYLTALDIRRTESLRIQGVTYGLGAVALTAAHIQSGILNPVSAPLSAALVPPAILGLLAGGWLGNRMDHRAFLKATQLVLLIVGLNLVRRGLFG